MARITRNVWRQSFGLLLVTAVLIAAGVGCSGGGSSNNTQGPPTLTVKVRSSSGPVAGVTVVLGDSTGAMVSASSYQVTGASGDIVFTNPPANATVTAARKAPLSWNTSVTIYEIHTLYDVNRSSVEIDIGQIDTTSPTIGTANVAVNNTLGAGITGWSVFPGMVWGNPTATVTIRQQDVQSDNKVSFMAFGSDANGDRVGYGTALDRAFVSGMSFTIDLNSTAFATANYTISNVPTTATEVWCNSGATRKGAGWLLIETYAATISSTMTCTARTVPGYGDSFEHYLDIPLDTNGNKTIDAYYGTMKGGTTFTTFTAQSFDISTFPTFLSNPSRTIVGGRQKFSWSGTSTSADVISGSINYSTPAAQYGYWFDASPARTSVLLPELPSTLSDFNTTWIDINGVQFNLENGDLVGISGYDALLSAIDTAPSFRPDAVEYRWAGITMINGTPYPAPKNNKAGISAPSTTGKKRLLWR